MNRSHSTPSTLSYSLSLLAMTATMLLSCNKTHMAAMQEDDYSFETQGTHHDRVTILESVPSQEVNPEVPGEVFVAGTSDRSVTDVHSDSISIAELASIERRIGLDDAGSRFTDAERHNAFVVTSDKLKSAATKIQSVARMYNSNKQLKAKSNETVRAAGQKYSKNPNRDQRLDLIKLGTVVASASALGGYVNNGLFNQQKEREAQTASEEANMRIRQLEELIQALEADKRSQTAVDFYTLNSDTSHHAPRFLGASPLYFMHPVWTPLGVSTFLAGGYVVRKISRSFQERNKEISGLKNRLDNEERTKKEQLAASTANARRLAEQLKTAERSKDNVLANVDRLQEQLAASTANARRLAEQLKTAERSKDNVLANVDRLQEQLAASTANARRLQEQLAASTANARRLAEQLGTAERSKDNALANVDRLQEQLTETREELRTSSVLAGQLEGQINLLVIEKQEAQKQLREDEVDLLVPLKRRLVNKLRLLQKYY